MVLYSIKTGGFTSPNGTLTSQPVYFNQPAWYIPLWLVHVDQIWAGQLWLRVWMFRLLLAGGRLGEECGATHGTLVTTYLLGQRPCSGGVESRHNFFLTCKHWGIIIPHRVKMKPRLVPILNGPSVHRGYLPFSSVQLSWLWGKPCAADIGLSSCSLDGMLVEYEQNLLEP